jgi:hypothetical protein
VAGSVADPQASALARLIGADEGTIRTGIALLLAVLIEVGFHGDCAQRATAFEDQAWGGFTGRTAMQWQLLSLAVQAHTVTPSKNDHWYARVRVFLQFDVIGATAARSCGCDTCASSS